ncbi:MAG TPA: CHAD domain-containing protein [Thermoanaerobaculia bacterium]|jgi:CHAD domain-containing protein|nr:CHAD domain-containing protein [Thermoanaerobaculia bacterium]
MAAFDRAPTEAARLLSRPPEEGARLLALAFLDQAAAARPRLDDPEDGEALHDFRVALRRLRSCLKAYLDDLGDSVPRKLARRLRRLADATGAGRDAEVQIAWLRGEGRPLAAVHRPGHVWLLARLAARKRDAYGEIALEVADEFAAVERDLRRRLSVYRTEVRLDRDLPRRTLGATAAEILDAQAAELAVHLGRVDGPGAETAAHQARIRAKRLRYLLEPFREEVPAAAPVVQRIKALQDLLGELHDAHVLEDEITRALAQAAAARAARLLELTLHDAPDDKLLRAERRRRHEPGLLALAKRNRDRRDRLYAELAQAWLDGRAGDFLALGWLAEALTAAGAAGGG